MRIRPGITQDFYKALSPDRKLLWKLATWCISLIASWLVTKTGYRVLDFAISTSCALVTMLMIESQRSYSEYSRKTRKLAIVSAIVMARWGICGLGIFHFSLVTVGAIGHALHDAPSINDASTGMRAVMVAIFIVIFIYQSINIFRRLALEDLVAKLPTEKLKQLLVKRRFVAHDFRSFLAFELGVAYFSYCYAWLVAGLASDFIVMLQA